MLRSFAKAREYIYIDPSTMSTTENWLKKKQRENGCFELVGALFNRRMKVSGRSRRLWAWPQPRRQTETLLLSNRVACLMKSPSLLTSPLASWR